MNLKQMAYYNLFSSHRSSRVGIIYLNLAKIPSFKDANMNKQLEGRFFFANYLRIFSMKENLCMFMCNPSENSSARVQF